MTGNIGTEKTITADLGNFRLIKGPAGESAYDYAVKMGYTGTEAEFGSMFKDIEKAGDYARSAAASAIEVSKIAENLTQGIVVPQPSGCINAIDYGFVPDGVTDNLEIFNAVVAKYPDATIYFGNGTYCFSGTLDVKKAYFILDGATLKLTKQVEKYFIKVMGEQNGEFPTEKMFIKGNGVIDGGGFAPVTLGIGTQKTMVIEGLKIKGFTLTGLEQGISEMTGYSYELIAKNLLIYNEVLSNTTGLYVNGDSTYSDIVILNCKTGIEVTGGGNCFHNIHGWNYDFTGSNKEIIYGTVMIKINADGNRFDQIYFDTYETGAVLGWAAKSAAFTNVGAYLNTTTLPDDFTKAYIFSAGNAGNDAAFLVSNCSFPTIGAGIIKLIDNENTNSKFVNCLNFTTGESFDTAGLSDSDIKELVDSYVGTDKFSNTVSKMVNDRLSDNNDEIKDYVDEIVNEALGGTAVPCTDLAISENSINMEVDDSYTLTCDVTPTNTTQKVRWSSTNESVVTVSNGLVKALGGGVSKIKVKCGSMTDFCDVTVTHGDYIFEVYNYESDASGFTSYTGNIDLSSQTVEAVADVSGYTGTAGVISLGLDITQWPGNNIHAYYNPEDKTVWYDVVIADNWEKQAKSSTITITDPSSLKLRIDSTGLYVNDSLAFSSTDGDIIQAVYTAINESESVMLGQYQQGTATLTSLTIKKS